MILCFGETQESDDNAAQNFNEPADKHLVAACGVVVAFFPPRIRIRWNIAYQFVVVFLWQHIL